MMQGQSASEVPGSEADPPALTHLEPFARLVSLVGRAFYDDLGFKGGDLTTSAGAENLGLAVVILDALTRYQWVEEDALASSLNVSKKMCLSILRYFEAERFLKRKTKPAIADQAAAAGASAKVTVKYYCCLDYPKICDITRFKLIAMKENAKSRLGHKQTIQTYVCQGCKKRYSSFDVIHLPSTEDSFQCENCLGKVMEYLDEELSDASGDRRKRRKTAVADLLKRIEEQLKPLVEQLDLIENLPTLDFSYLDEDSSASITHGIVRFIEETTVEASNKTLDDEAEANLTDSKILPEWMIKDGMQHKKLPVGYDSVPDQYIQDAYAKAYMEALNKRLAQK